MILTVTELLVGDGLAFQVVPRHDFVDLVFSLFSELVHANLDLDNVGISFQRVFQRGRVALFDFVARDVQFADALVQLEVLGQRFAELVSKQVAGQVEGLNDGLVLLKIVAQFASSFVVKAVQFQTERNQGFVDLEGAGDETTAAVVN